MSEAPVIVEDMPVIVHEGRYRLYRKPDGGLHLAYKRDDEEDLQHLDLPAQMVKLAEMAGQGRVSPTDMLRELMKMRP